MWFCLSELRGLSPRGRTKVAHSRTGPWTGAGAELSVLIMNRGSLQSQVDTKDHMSSCPRLSCPGDHRG